VIWAQIEKQLNESLSLDSAVSQILVRIRDDQSGTFYGGTFFQRIILPMVFRLLPNFIIRASIRFWYS